MTRRVLVALTISTSAGLLLLPFWKLPVSSLFVRTTFLGLAGVAAFAIFAAWPRRLPRWCQRWVLQVVAVGLAMAATTFLLHRFAALPAGVSRASEQHDMLVLSFTAILLAPWTALAAIIRQKDAFARDQQLAFALERSELERQALDARLHLLQAQVAPHF